MLNFTGIGSAFNPEEGNTSAYFSEEDSFYLIDCGELVFKELLREVDFSIFSDLHIFITHSHSDHIGSLGTLISYLHHHHSIPVTIYHGGIHLLDFLNRLGISSSYYEEVTDKKLALKDFTFEWIETKHSDKIACFGLLLSFEDSMIYYSGDARIVPERIYQAFMADEIDFIYQDLSIDSENTSHLTLKKLTDLIPKSKRQRIIAMHLEVNSKEAIEAVGFQTAQRQRKIS